MTFGARVVAARIVPNAEGVGDGALMSRIADGDREAYAALVDRYLARILRLAIRMIGNASDAEDIAQDVFMRVWLHAKTWRPEKAQFGTWLYQIAINRCLDHRRRRWFVSLELAAEVEDPKPGTDAVVFRRETSRLVAKAVATLPDRQRAALILCHFEEMSVRDAAAVLTLSVSAIESLLVRARRTLRARLEALDLNEVGFA
jgi:RNA polymerase sigma-70 factor (ECF subfamily)